MHDRIKSLWDTAAKLASDPSWEGQTRFIEKFTQLIIEECALELSRVPGGYDSPLFYKNSQSLKEHFGVKS